MLEEVANILGDSTLDAWDETYIKQLSNIADDAALIVDFMLRQMKEEGVC
jgi:hypothetical protein